MKNFIRVFSIICLLVILSACKKESKLNPETDYIIYDNGEGTIGAGGGSIKSSDGAVELTVPSGALTENKILSIDIIENGQNKSDFAEICGSSIQLLGYESDFKNEVELKIHLSPGVVSKIDDQHSISIYQERADLNAYLYQKSEFNKEDLTLTTSLNHLSIYLVIVNIEGLWKPFTKQYNWTILGYPTSTGNYPSNVTKSEVDGSVNKAIDTWGYYLAKVGYKFEQVDVNNPIEKDILISWVDDLGIDDAQGGWSIGLGSKVILFNNTTCSWIANDVPRTPKTLPESIRTVTLHEFGHVLGFTHLFNGQCPEETEEPSCFGPAVMAPYFGVKRDYFDLDLLDLDRLCRKYNIVLNEPGFITDVDGNVYNTVTIDTQVWMKENLKTTKYNDGTFIPNITDNTRWIDIRAPAYCWYNNDKSTYNATYGAIYNGFVVDAQKNGGKNVCPIGWHVPSDSEWTSLTTYLVGESIAGGKLKETGTTHWLSPNTGATNESAFTALPGGWRDLGFNYLSVGGFWWTATRYDENDNALYRNIFYDNSELFRNPASEHFGFSIRCLKDN